MRQLQVVQEGGGIALADETRVGEGDGEGGRKEGEWKREEKRGEGPFYRRGKWKEQPRITPCSLCGGLNPNCLAE